VVIGGVVECGIWQAIPGEVIISEDKDSDRIGLDRIGLFGLLISITKRITALSHI
jgi:hypothetical protein